MKQKTGFFKCMDSMAQDMHHPYIPSTTVLGDTYDDTQNSVCAMIALRL